MSRLLLDEILPHPDHAIAHAAVFRARPEQSFSAALDLDILRNPFVRMLVAARGAAAGGERPQRLSLRDMTSPPLGWLRLADDPGTELVLGQVSRPWRLTDGGAVPALSPEAFRDFDTPGYAKVAVSLRAQPYGAAGSILTIETRVALTDAGSRSRFVATGWSSGPSAKPSGGSPSGSCAPSSTGRRHRSGERSRSSGPPRSSSTPSRTSATSRGSTPL